MARTLREALSILQAGEWCALRFLTADVLKGKGGKVIELAKCRIARRQPVAASTANKPAVIYSSGKNPNHRYHFTVNVELQNKQLRKVHPILITHINHEPVL